MSVRSAAILLLSFLPGIFSCGSFGNEELELFYSGKIITRGQAKAELGAAVAVNYTNCPQNATAGIYATDYTIPTELNHVHYKKDSVDSCAILLMITPCGLNPSANPVYLANLYRAVVRGCNLKNADL